MVYPGRKGAPFATGIPIKAQHTVEVKKGWVWVSVALAADGSVYWSKRTWVGSKTVWTKPALYCKDKYPKATNIQIFRSQREAAGYFQVIVSANDERGCECYWTVPGDFGLKEEEEEEEEDPKLKIYNNFICYYGLKPINLVGVYRWESLWRELHYPIPKAMAKIAQIENGYANVRAEGAYLQNYYSWGDKSLNWYEEEIFKYPINCIRTGGVKDTAFLYEHCRRMRDNGPQPVMVEVTVFRGLDEGVLVTLKDMPELAKLGNVFFDINEFCITEWDEGEKNLKKAIEIVEFLADNNCIVAAGSWGASSYGEDFAEKFCERCKEYHLKQHHRVWTEASLRASLGHGKSTILDEYFARYLPLLNLKQTKDIMKMATDMKIHTLYYGFADEELNLPGLNNFDSFDYREMLKYAGGLCQELNP